MKSVIRGLDILAVVAHPHGRSFAELAAVTRIPRSSLYRFVAALESRGFMRQDMATKKYVPGPALFRLGGHDNGFDQIRRAIRVEMPSLVDRVGESAYLYVRDGADRICIEGVESPREAIKHVVRPGSRFPLYAGASGKVILACLPEAEREGLLQPSNLKRVGPGTVISRRVLRGELTRIQNLGYAYSEEEVSAGAWALAVPIQDGSRATVASLAIAGPLFRLDRDHIPLLARRLKKLVDHVSVRLGLPRRTFLNGTAPAARTAHPPGGARR